MGSGELRHVVGLLLHCVSEVIAVREFEEAFELPVLIVTSRSRA